MTASSHAAFATPPQTDADGIRLHIGGREPHADWKILDVLPGPHVDFIGNCSDLSFLPDESCAEVYASHVLEHLGYDRDLPKALVAIHRILKQGGRLRVAVPDLEMLCRLFLHPALDGEGRFQVMRMMFGGRTTEHDVHHVGLNFEFLQSFLQEVGFRDIQRVSEFGLFDDASTLKFGDVPISLNVEAVK
jgi:predicted SAM-dependent methyltransferase